MTKTDKQSPICISTIQSTNNNPTKKTHTHNDHTVKHKGWPQGIWQQT